MKDRQPLDDRACLEILAGFGPRFREPGASFGEVVKGTGSGTLTDPYIPGFHDSSELSLDFVHKCYAWGWVSPDFDMNAWLDTDEAKALKEDKTAIARADVDQLTKLLTFFMRRDRFNMGGSLPDDFSDGSLLAIVERAEAILKNGESVSGQVKHYFAM